MNVLVVGLGRIGLPQALTLAKSGHTVVGLDNDSDQVNKINSKSSPFWEPKLDQLLEETLRNGSFRAISSADIDSNSSSFNAIVISLGAPVDSTPQTFVDMISATRITEFIESDPELETLLLNRATVPIGTTQAIAEYLDTALSQMALSHVHIAHMPERISEGKAIAEEWTLPKLVGVETQAGFEIVEQLFEGFDADVVRLPSPAHTEFGKLMENSWRDLTFAFSNDMALLCEELHLDVAAILKAANFNYPRNSIPSPGPVSGYCLSKDPLILDSMRNTPVLNEWKANTLSGIGREVHASTIDHIVRRIISSLEGVTAPDVAVIGMAFKPNIDDFRQSHAVHIAESILRERPDAILHHVDPYMDSNRYTKLPVGLSASPHRKYNWMSELDCSNITAAVICTPHDQIWPGKEGKDNSSLLKRELSMSDGLELVYDCSGTFAESELSLLPQYRRLGLFGSAGELDGPEV
jgi:UDP-N-acetyl-D-mannosaminuronic acid dehydrogenase